MELHLRVYANDVVSESFNCYIGKLMYIHILLNLLMNGCIKLFTIF